jgi:uncharacterized protein
MKDCNGCTLCCYVFAIDEFDKPRWEKCKFQEPGVGCSSYESRPERCRIFSCLWQQEVRPFSNLFPGKVGFLAGYNVSTKSVDIHPSPDTPHKWIAHKKLLVKLGSRVPVVLVEEIMASPIGELAKAFKFEG